MSAFSLRPHMSWTLKQEPWCLFLFFISFFLLIFLGPQPRHMEVPVLGVESGCRWSAYIHHNHINTTSKPHLSPTHGSGKHQILNPLSKARDQTSVLMDTSRPCYHWAATVTLFFFLFKAASIAYGIFQARGWIRSAAAGLYYSHSNTRSESHLWPTPQLMAISDP